MMRSDSEAAGSGWLKDIMKKKKPLSKKTDAKKDICRLKWNWLFVCSVVTIRALNHSCPLPTIHQFIINPNAENLNITEKEIEPGLQQSEVYYSLTYSMFYLGHVLTALIAGYLSNKIPMWYLFMGTIVLHIMGYVLYALSTTGWMMMISRILAGISMGAAIAVSFAYLGFSTERYADNLRILGEYDARKVAQVKGYVYSLFNVGTGVGYIVGAFFPIALSQYDVNQFRPPGWFCAGIGVLLLLLQLAVFRGECACTFSCERKCDSSLGRLWKKMNSGEMNCSNFFVTVIIPLYILLTGGVKGARYVIPDMLLSPVLSDAFGFSEEYISYFFLSVLGSIIGTTIVLMFQSCGFHGYFLSVVGGVMTMAALLIMTDWQAIPYDSCTELSIFHHPELADKYRLQLLTTSNDSATVESFGDCPENMIPETNISMRYHALYFSSGYYHYTGNALPSTECTMTAGCPQCDKDANCAQMMDTGGCQIFDKMQATKLCATQCTSVAGAHSASSCFIVDTDDPVAMETVSSTLEEVHLQSLRVVRDDVYELAVKECESADQCHWVPHSLITHDVCDDCQPICRGVDHSLNFAQFTVGLTLLMCTMEVMYIGMFILLSDSVSKSYQGIAAGALVASIGTARSTAPLWLDYAYEGAGKRTYLPMLVLFSLIFPLWVGLLILYPWLAGKYSRAHQRHSEKQSDNHNNEENRLIPMSNVKGHLESD